MKTNYILVDYENVQPRSAARLKGGPFKLKIFVGSQKPRIPFDLAQSMQLLGDAAEYVPIEGNGRNALDFHIAYFIGRLAATEPDAFFHIISKDSGFDVLIKYLHSQGVFCKRSATLDGIPLLKATGAKSLEERVEAVVAHFSGKKAPPPARVKTLTSALSKLFADQLDAKELERLIGELQKRGMIKLEGVRVSYQIPSP